MDNNTGIASALAAMRPDEDRKRYEGCVMFSALPDAPTISSPTVRERLLDLRRRRAGRAGGRRRSVSGGRSSIGRLRPI